jgi:FMN-dependent NADH-azoreductase
MKLLHIDGSITGDTSVSRQISKAVVDRLREGVSDLEVTYRDLTSAPIPHLAGPPAPEGEAELEELSAPTSS